MPGEDHTPLDSSPIHPSLCSNEQDHDDDVDNHPVKDYLLHPQEDGAVRYYQIVKAADIFIKNTQRENIFGKTIKSPMYWAANNY